MADGDLAPGFKSSIAVPVPNVRGAVVASLNTGMAATHRVVQEMVETYLSALLKVQAGIERVLT
ncbi:hypothetical protein [Tropicibacter sp. Alg240-R139]|uniref:hypothetical protein n=1 Tax=Tropicibacter sp. Alg240-R139 TaxID=2305991 RepID=UPI0013DF8C49|nr:hypothetical protein [Tropicibacter sp. Alg240-R139]